MVYPQGLLAGAFTGALRTVINDRNIANVEIRDNYPLYETLGVLRSEMMLLMPELMMVEPILGTTVVDYLE